MANENTAQRNFVETSNANEETVSNEVLKRAIRSIKRHIHHIAKEENKAKRRRLNASIASSLILELNEETANGSNSQINNSSTEETTCIADLPAEMLEAILQNVTTLDLLKCRQMNRKWSEISLRIMRQRTDMELRFCFDDDEGEFLRHFPMYKNYELIANIADNDHSGLSCMSLSEFASFLQNGNNFPYTSFRFDHFESFANEEMKSFLSIWGTNILALNIRLEDPTNDIEILRDLLFRKVPNLRKLEAQFCRNESQYTFWKKNPSSVQLFVNAKELQLPMLEVLCVNSRYRKFRGIIENILVAACNLKNFELTDRNPIRIRQVPFYYEKVVKVNPQERIAADDLTMLQSLNKLHCVHSLRLYVSESLIDSWEKSANSMCLKLQSLDLSFQPSILLSNQLKARATEIINRLLQSSMAVIQILAIEPLGFLPGLFIPQLKQLYKLDLWPFLQSESSTCAMFPPPFVMADIFPNLRELAIHLPCNDDFFPPSRPLKLMPSVEVLRICGDTSLKSNEKLMTTIPNVKTLLLLEETYPPVEWKTDFINCFRAIANNFTNLESLRLLILRKSYHELLYSLDAAITGLPEEFCKETSMKFRNKDRLSADELVSHQLIRQNSSILNLKELKDLDVNFIFPFDTVCDIECSCCDGADEAGFNDGNKFYRTGFTKVSEFAFDLNPNLKIHTNKELIFSL